MSHHFKAQIKLWRARITTFVRLPPGFSFIWVWPVMRGLCAFIYHFTRWNIDSTKEKKTWPTSFPDWSRYYMYQSLWKGYRSQRQWSSTSTKMELVFWQRQISNLNLKLKMGSLARTKSPVVLVSYSSLHPDYTQLTSPVSSHPLPLTNIPLRARGHLGSMKRSSSQSTELLQRGSVCSSFFISGAQACAFLLLIIWT